MRSLPQSNYFALGLRWQFHFPNPSPEFRQLRRCPRTDWVPLFEDQHQNLETNMSFEPRPCCNCSNIPIITSLRGLFNGNVSFLFLRSTVDLAPISRTILFQNANSSRINQNRVKRPSEAVETHFQCSSWTSTRSFVASSTGLKALKFTAG